MAKSKSGKKVLDEEPISQPTDAAVDIDVSASEIETDAAAGDADEDAELMDDAGDADGGADDDGGGDDGNEDDAPADEPARKPRPKITWLTVVLILLNWIAVPAFLAMAYLDYNIRMQHSYRAVVNYAQQWGLPLRDALGNDTQAGQIDEEHYPSLSNETRPVLRLTPAQLADAFKKRPGVNGAVAKDFAASEEPVPVRLRPSDMTDQFLEDLYGNNVPAAERFKTVEAAIEFVRDKTPGDIVKAAEDVKSAFKAKKEDEKRAFVQKSLFIMTWDSGEAKKMEDQIAAAQREDLDDLVNRALVEKILYPIALDHSDLKDGRRVWVVDRIEEDLAKAKGPELEKLVEEAVQRRLYYDILAPLNLFRPADVKAVDVERFADRDKFAVDKLKSLLTERIGAAADAKYNPSLYIGKEYFGATQDRSSVEKRQHAAFILFTLAHVRVPVLDKKLYPKGIERAQTVSGLYEFTNASVAYVKALRTLERRTEERVKADREGNIFGAGDKVNRTDGFIDRQPAQIDSMQRLVEQIDAAQKRLEEKKAQRDQFKKIYDQRLAQHKELTARLIKARQLTETYAKDLRKLQDDLHAALLELSDAADTNFRLEREIRALELSYYKTAPTKGSKKQP